MVRARKAIFWGVAGLCAGLLSLPAIAAAKSSGGTAAPAAGPSLPAPTATAGAVSVTPSTVNEREVAVVTGAVPAASGSGHGLWLQVRATAKTGGWVTVASAAAAADGSFTIAWRANRAGQLSLRVVSAGVASASSVTATPQVPLTVYEPVVATWYGPGFYGNHTACGEKLTRSIVGLADRTLPCGTAVSVSYNGLTLTIPVIDRGPYANGATLDLTRAAAQELGLKQTSTVEMLSLGGPLIAPTNWFPPSSAPPPGGATGASGATLAGGATAPGS